MSNQQNSIGGGSFLGLLTVAFIVLKLCGIITWSWWWVLCPTWAPIAVIAGVLITLGVISVLDK